MNFLLFWGKGKKGTFILDKELLLLIKDISDNIPIEAFLFKILKIFLLKKLFKSTEDISDKLL